MHLRSINNNGNYTCSCHLYDYHNMETIYSLSIGKGTLGGICIGVKLLKWGLE